MHNFKSIYLAILQKCCNFMLVILVLQQEKTNVLNPQQNKKPETKNQKQETSKQKNGRTIQRTNTHTQK